VDAARALGVHEGPDFGRLQRGQAVTAQDGATVTPAQVVGERRLGRRLVFSGDTRPCRGVLEAAQGADLLVHEASFVREDEERARETGHSTAHEAASVGRAAGVRLLALTHLGQRAHPRDVKREAREVFEPSVVPRDFDIIDVPFPERGPPELRRAAAAGGAPRRDGEAAAQTGSEVPKEDPA
jgi:ribonuclease Z